MGNVNKVILIGNLGADVELKRVAATQRAYCHLRIATNATWKDDKGQRQERTDWHRVILWGELAEHCAAHLTKGRSVYVEGKLETHSWEDDQKKRHWSTEVVASRVLFLDAAVREAA